MLKEMEKDNVNTMHNLKESYDRKKSYAYFKRVEKELKFGDHAYIRVKPSKSSLNLGSCSYWNQDIVGH